MSTVVPISSGTLIIDYVVEQVIGQGGFGTVYLVTDTTLQKKFALKEYTPHNLVVRSSGNRIKVQDPAKAHEFKRGIKAFLREARRLAKFSHPNIIRVVRFFETNNTAYLVTDIAEGGSLRELLNSHQDAWTENEIRNLLLPICSGVANMHDEGLIHGDIKPDNIVIGKSGEPILIDMGASLELDQVSDNDVGMIATPAYAPPEQLSNNGPRGPWLDVFAIAATLYEVMSGQPPRWARRGSQYDPLVPASASDSVANEIRAIPLADVAHKCYSTQLMMVVDRCLESDYRARPHSIDGLIRALLHPNDLDTAPAAIDISEKMLQHFLNFAKPNDDLFADELAMFIVTFPVLDFAWRLGGEIPVTKALEKLSADTESLALVECYKRTIVGHGFSSLRDASTSFRLGARADEYAASYELDRQEDRWTYSLTRRQLVLNCLAPKAGDDVQGFSELMEVVINRARSRVKKVVRAALTPYYWIMTSSGWERKIRQDIN